MNPLPFVWSMILRDRWQTLAFILLFAVATALGVAITAQERALRQGSAHAADPFDLIVSAPGSQTDVMLKTIFLKSGTVELLAPDVVAKLLSDDRAAYAAPLGFGDNYKGDPLIGTTRDLVAAVSKAPLREGRLFEKADEAVVGFWAKPRIGESFHAEHGQGEVEADGSHEEHHATITVVGRMAPTGSPWDHAIIVPIEQMWLAHNLPAGHDPQKDQRIGQPFDAAFLSGVPAVIVKPKTLGDAYKLRGAYRTTQSTAFFPAEALLELYALMGDVRQLLSVMALGTQALVIAATVAGVSALLRFHRRQFATLRVLGAPGTYVFAAIWTYVAALVGSGAVLGLVLGYGFAVIASGYISQTTGIAMRPAIGFNEVRLVLSLFAIGCLFAVIPAFRLYRAPILETLR